MAINCASQLPTNLPVFFDCVFFADDVPTTFCCYICIYIYIIYITRRYILIIFISMPHGSRSLSISLGQHVCPLTAHAGSHVAAVDISPDLVVTGAVPGVWGVTCCGNAWVQLVTSLLKSSHVYRITHLRLINHHSSTSATNHFLSYPRDPEAVPWISSSATLHRCGPMGRAAAARKCPWRRRRDNLQSTSCGDSAESLDGDGLMGLCLI